MPNPAYTCDLLVISCIDFRIQPLISDFVHKEFPDEMYDFAAFAGSAKNLPLAEEQVRISKHLHHIKTVLLIQHQDCGAYGRKESVREEQIQDLYTAKETLLEQYPDIDVRLLYLHITGFFEEVTINH